MLQEIAAQIALSSSFPYLITALGVTSVGGILGWRYFDWELVNGRSSLEQLQQNLLIYPSDGMPVRFWLRK